MKRNLEPIILSDLPTKIVLIMGPRQCGKTTLAKQLSPDNFDYFSFDSAEDRKALQEKSWNRKKKLIIFDELHKKKEWKRWLKGIYDTEGIPPEYVVTGSARLDVHRKVGDSLAGRYFPYRLHPIDLKEAAQFLSKDHETLFDNLWNCSGFPEPFIKGDVTYYKRWRKTHLDIILRQDLIDLYAIRDLKAIEILVQLLKERVGSTVSYANLARDLEYDQTTIKRWLQLLENLYIIYRVTPYSNNVARSLLKEPKFYFYDSTYAENGDGAKLENLVANALFKELHYLEDTQGMKASLHYLRTKDGKELDFLVCLDNVPTVMIEVKQADLTPSKGFEHFSRYFKSAKMLQVVRECKRDKTYPSGVDVVSLIPWLVNLDLSR